MKIFDHFWIDLTSANEDNGEKPWLSELNVKDAKKDKKIHIKNQRIGSCIQNLFQLHDEPRNIFGSSTPYNPVTYLEISMD